MQLISGLRTGSAVVSVALHESIYKSVLPSQVRLLVMANAQLSPALAYLVPNSLLTFTVHVIQQGDDQGKYCIVTYLFFTVLIRSNYGNITFQQLVSTHNPVILSLCFY